MYQPRLWWQEVAAGDWTVFAYPDDLIRDRYTALLAALDELSTRGPMATLDEIAARAKEVGYLDPLGDAELRDTLDRLAKWGFAEPFRDFAAPVRDYQGVIVRQEAWALTRKGRAIVSAVRTAVTDFRRAQQLVPSRLLDQVAMTLAELIGYFEGDQGLLPAALNNAYSRLSELQWVTAEYYAALAQMVQSDVTDDELFGGHRDRVLEALRQFPREYGRALPRAVAALDNLKRIGYRHLAEAAVPHAGLIDTAEYQHWIDEHVRHLADLESWLQSGGTLERLIGSASGAVHQLIVAIDRRYAARRRGADLSVDFRVLARSLHRQPDDEDTRRVFAAAFGDWPAWHAVTGPSEEDIAHGTLAAAGIERHRVDVTLREHERQGPIGGRPRKVPDTKAERATALAAALAESQRRGRLARSLITEGEVGLDHFTGLNSEAADTLLQAIEVALDNLDSKTGCGQGHADGANVIVRVRRGEPDRFISVAFAEGTLTGPELWIEVVSTETVSGHLDSSVA